MAACRHGCMSDRTQTKREQIRLSVRCPCACIAILCHDLRCCIFIYFYLVQGFVFFRLTLVPYNKSLQINYLCFSAFQSNSASIFHYVTQISTEVYCVQWIHYDIVILLFSYTMGSIVLIASIASLMHIIAMHIANIEQLYVFNSTRP